jgi:hypothetical protein
LGSSAEEKDGEPKRKPPNALNFIFEMVFGKKTKIIQKRMRMRDFWILK